MKKEQLLFVPLVGKTSACRQKEGLKLIKGLPLLPRLAAVLPPQGREIARGFTLIELLVVVLIISILAAVALPQYQKTVLKSRFAALMPIAKSIANGNEMYYLTHGQYSQDPAELDVAAQDAKYSDGTDVDVVNTDKYSYVMATRDNNFPLNYIVYQKHSKNFPDNIHCEASNTMAEGVCQSLGGQVLESGSQHDGYTTYILKGSASDGKMPTSLSKLVVACEKNANCTVSEQGNNTTLQECEGDLTGTNIKTCTSITYDEEGEEKDYKRTEQQCGQGIPYWNRTNGWYQKYEGRTRSVCTTKAFTGDGTLSQTLYQDCSPTDCSQTGLIPNRSSYIYNLNADGTELSLTTYDCGVDTCRVVSGTFVNSYTEDGKPYVSESYTQICKTSGLDGTCQIWEQATEIKYKYTDGSVQTTSIKNCSGSNVNPENGRCLY